MFFLAFASELGKEALAALLFCCPKYLGGQCVKQGSKKGQEKENQKVERNSQEMNLNSQFIKAIHILGRFHHPIDVLRTDFSTRFFRRTDNTSARSSATGDLFDVNGGFPRRLRDLLTRFDFFFRNKFELHPKYTTRLDFFHFLVGVKSCGTYWIRTSDLLPVKQAL